MTEETITLLTWLIPLPPVLAFFLIVLFTNRSKALSHTIAVGAAFLSFLGSMIIFVYALGVEHFGEHPIQDAINWLPTGDTWFRIGVLIDPVGAAVLFFVAWTIFMIFLYSVGYQNFGQPEGDHDVKGLPPHGATVEEAVRNGREVMELWIDSARKWGDPIPPPRYFSPATVDAPAAEPAGVG